MIQKVIIILLVLFSWKVSAQNPTEPDTVSSINVSDTTKKPDFEVYKSTTNLESTEFLSSVENIRDTLQIDSLYRHIDSLERFKLLYKMQNNELLLVNDSLADIHQILVDSLDFNRQYIDKLLLKHQDFLLQCNNYKDSLIESKAVVDSLIMKVKRLRKRNELLQPLNKELNAQIKNLEEKIAQQSQMLDQQIEKIKEKEELFKEKEQIYQNAIQESKIDLVKLEGQLESKNSQLAGKDREIELLAESIAERKADILKKNQEIDQIKEKRTNEIVKIDTLRDHISKIEKELLLTKTRLEYSTKEIKALKDRIHELTNKKKKIRLVQGIGIRNFRSPLYTLAPESSDNPDRYVISNENAGDFEFDFVTGATFRLLDIGKKDAKYTSDVGFFLGFGGKNLFKNFYIGPNIKIFDVIHINAGINIAEYRLLKSGFSEGDLVPQGTSIPTVSKWEITPYFGLTFDFSLITSIAGKL